MADPSNSDQNMKTLVLESLRDRATQADSINTSLPLAFINVSHEHKLLEMSVEASPWTRNVSGIMHGGAISTAFDITMGLLCKAYANTSFTPTISLQVNFCKPVPLGACLHIQAKLSSVNRKFFQVQAEAWAQDQPNTILATASAIFYRASGEDV
ncbi:MAG: PaaI family thioesterase [Clostridia bacterium]|nr:PaaI family thioesterase [Clostridia bacterium]